jgi:hypothetical protein
MIIKFKDKKQWHLWFAWRPVRLEKIPYLASYNSTKRQEYKDSEKHHTWVWWDWVERKKPTSRLFQSGGGCKYRLPGNSP